MYLKFLIYVFEVINTRYLRWKWPFSQGLLLKMFNTDDSHIIQYLERLANGFRNEIFQVRFGISNESKK